MNEFNPAASSAAATPPAPAPELLEARFQFLYKVMAIGFGSVVVLNFGLGLIFSWQTRVA